ncbi:hypothetical protein AGMMS49940_00790 [Spirochaetia bacterium]|nr:hypothetical protein AGMMS49940_00790 [Spirochaetia bacterium]
MTKFIALFEKSGKSIPEELMIRHIDHLKNLKKNNNLLLCGPFKNSKGVIQLLQADNYDEAKKLALLDPFTAEGIFSTYTIHELIEANEENNYLLGKK